MKREFNVGDIAHLSKGKRVRGILNYKKDNECYKDFTMRWKDEVKILKHYKADDRVGSYVYDCEVNFKGVTYIVENICQFDLVPKKMWEESVRLDRIIKELRDKEKVD